MALALTTLGVEATTQNDGGSGGDAGESPAGATPLPSEGRYTGTLTFPGDSDWFKLALPTNTLCVEGSAHGAILADLTLSTDPQLISEVKRAVEPTTTALLGLAMPGATVAYLGLTHTNNQPGPGGAYGFEIDAIGGGELGPGDGGSGGDAGPDEGAVAVSRPCVGGSLWWSQGDRVDHYTIEGNAGEHLTLTLAQAASAPLAVALLDPTGERVLEIVEGEVGRVELDEAGLWTLSVSQTSSGPYGGFVPYILGLSGGPNPNPCRPTCW